ncbi:hypothetical protein ACFLYB_03675 [Chloroflexota bacterium]
MLDILISKILGIHKFEKKLSLYHGYRKNSIITWKKQTGLKWPCIKKILSEFLLFGATDIRYLFKESVKNNTDIFNNKCYYCSFGDPGKSGGVVLYEFKKAFPQFSSRIIEISQIPELPPQSNIVFLDDILGTGRQSEIYITSRLNMFLNPSHNAYLLTLCASPQGIERITVGTNIDVKCAMQLTREKYQYCSEECHIFQKSEKSKLTEMNNLLNISPKFDYDLGLLVGFYYSIPNNTMSCIWKDGYPYISSGGKRKKWFALLPREY